MHHRLEPKDYLGLCGRKERARIARTKGLVDFIKVGTRDTLHDEIRGLYEHSFRNPDERIPWHRLSEAIENGHVHAIAGLRNERPVAFFFFKVREAGCESIVALMYMGIADAAYMKSRYGVQENFRGLGIAGALYAFGHGIAQNRGRGNVIGMLGDSEFIGQAPDEAGIRYTKKRLEIHAKTGLLPLLLDMGSGCMVTAGIQPKLGPDTKDLLLLTLYRPVSLEGYDDGIVRELDIGFGRKLVRGYIDSYDSTDAAGEDRASAAAEAESRVRAAKRFVLVPPNCLPDIVDLASSDPLLKAQVERDYGPLPAHKERIRKALGNGAAQPMDEPRNQ